MVSALLLATRRPSLLDLSRLEEWQFISTEVTSDEVSRWATALNTTDVFQSVYSTVGAWGSKAKGLAAHATDPEQLILREDSFETITAWDNAAGPNELAFLARTSIADLLHAESPLSDERLIPNALVKASGFIRSINERFFVQSQHVPHARYPNPSPTTLSY